MAKARYHAERIADELLAAGLRPGSVVFVHSSLSKLGWVEGGPETVIAGLRRALGKQGTLLLPGFSFSTVTKEQPLFDIRHTPSCVGAISEYFRTMPGVVRSWHPTHSVCGIGPLAQHLIDRHAEDETPVGAHSPLRTVRDLWGQVVFLGCGVSPNTSMHGVEELARPPFFLREYYTYQMTDWDGQVHNVRHRHHDFRGWRQRYERLEPFLARGTELHEGPVLEGRVHIMEARALWARGVAEMKRNPFAFVERIIS
ncbi:MAG: AAC(3) family N-acetyltransferase [Chloroflexi bacterium]|nr:AAC(3) family N-acetyltransferase [Chloroflexota bacterium]